MFDFLKRKKKAAAAGAKKPLPPSSLKQSLLSLEQRLMFDAAAAATAAEVKSEQVAQEQAEAAVSTEASHETTGAENVESQDVLNALASYMPTEARTEVVFVDPTVPNYQELLAGLDPNAEVVMLDAGQDGVRQIADSLAGRTGVDAIHLISHGNAGELRLGTSCLTQESMTGHYAGELAAIRQSLSEQADLLIYGCDFAKGGSGQAAVNCLAEMTGADVEASNDLTGNAALGGDWDLEVKTGSIEARIAVDVHVQADWMGLLAAPALDATKSPVLNSLAEDAGAPSGTVGTLVSSLVDFAAPSGQVDNVTDGDAGAQLGIAITAADTSHGTWWYTTNNGSTWNALGAVGEGSARLLAADANTRLYFQGNADYNGTMSDAMTFRAWDQTSGTAGGTADLIGGTSTVKDQFGSASYGNNNGTANWSGNWGETDSGGGGASGGKIQIKDGALDIRAETLNNELSRAVNLSNATSATLSFSYSNNLGGGDQISVQVSIDGGAHYTTLTGGNFSNALHTGSGTVSFDITSAISANTRVRFLVTAEHDNDHLYVDNVQISYSSPGTGGDTAFSGSTDTAALTVTSINDAPTDLTLSANQVAEQAANGTVVGTVTATDVDAGDTKSYSFTDSAGGRFAINSSMGQITVADGSLLNYERAASHSVTVRVTDSGGLTYDEAFTINLTNINEAPTGADATVTISEDTSHTVTTANFGFSDVDAGDAMSAVRIDSLPTAGSLTLSGVAVTAGQVVSVADVAAGRLVFTPAADANGPGYASVTFSVRDSAGTCAAAPNTLTFSVTAVNDAPSDLALSSSTVAEQAANGTVVGTVTATDVDAGDTKSYRLTDTAGGRFAINSSTGQITVADGSLLNYESAASHSVTVRVTDSGGLTYDETFAINLTNVNETPTDLSLSSNTVAENAVNGTVVGTITGTDPDAGDTKSYRLTDTAGGRFAINSSTGQITVADGSLLNYERAASHNVTVRVTDSGGLTCDKTFAIQLTNANEAGAFQPFPGSLVPTEPRSSSTSGFGTSGAPGLAPESISGEFRPPEDLRRAIEIAKGVPLAVAALAVEWTYQEMAEEEFVTEPRSIVDEESRDNAGQRNKSEKRENPEERQQQERMDLPSGHESGAQEGQAMTENGDVFALRLETVGVVAPVPRDRIEPKGRAASFSSPPQNVSRKVLTGEQSDEPDADGSSPSAGEPDHSDSGYRERAGGTP